MAACMACSSLIPSTIVIPLFIELIKHHSWGFFICILLKYVYFTHPLWSGRSISIERDLQLVQTCQHLKITWSNDLFQNTFISMTRSYATGCDASSQARVLLSGGGGGWGAGGGGGVKPGVPWYPIFDFLRGVISDIWFFFGVRHLIFFKPDIWFLWTRDNLIFDFGGGGGGLISDIWFFRGSNIW